MKYIRIVAVLFLCAFVASAVPAWGQKVKDIKYPALNPFEIPKPDKVTLDNGMTLYFLEDHTLPRLSLSIRINKCGSYLEPAAKIGLAEMTGAVMRTGGTSSMTGDQIDEALESIGAYVETYIGDVSGGASANGLSDKAEIIVKTLADVLRNPVFNEDKITLEKSNERSSISRRNDEPMSIATREFGKLLYGASSPYARTAEYATIDAITRDDMIMFHKMCVQPNNMQLAVWGDFKKDEMLALIKKYFGDWVKGQMDIPAPPKVDYAFHPSVNHAEKSDINQSTILIGHIGGVMGDPDYAATTVMNTILGETFGSRLFRNVRTKMGLAYAAGGSYTFNFDYPGGFYSYTLTKSESTVKAIRAMIEQIKSMQTVPPTLEEMKLGKDGFLNSFVFNFDTKGKIINRMMTYDYYKMPPDYLQQIKTAVEKLTPEDIMAVAKRKLNPDNLQILVVGKAADFDEPLSGLGQVNEIDITIPQPKVEQFAATDAELAKGKETLAKVVKACGGVANFKKIKSMNTDAKVTLSMPQGSMNMDISKVEVLPDKSAQTIKMPMGTQTIVYDGTSGWMSAMGKSQAMPSAQLDEEKKDIGRNSVLLFAKSDQPDFKVADKGEADFEGKKAIRLDFLTLEGTQFSMFLDPATSLPSGLKYSGQTMAGPGEVIETYDAYKPFGGIMMATKTVQKAGGMDMTIDVVKIDVNGKYDETLFKKPDGI